MFYEKALLVQHSAHLLVSLKGITMQRKSTILNTKNPLLLWPEGRLFDLDPYLLCACILLAVNSVFGIAETHGTLGKENIKQRDDPALIFQWWTAKR